MPTSYSLSEADRERFGTPEWMTLDLTRCTLGDVTELSDRFGFEIEDWPAVLFPSEGVKPPKWRMQAVLWLTLHAAGVEAAWEDVGKVEILRVRSRSEDEAGKESGSDVEQPPQTPEPSTTPPSSTSSPD